jgi:hypothetical protein
VARLQPQVTMMGNSLSCSFQGGENLDDRKLERYEAEGGASS